MLLTHGTGRWEDPQNSWRVADVLGAPNRVDEGDHDWPAWRKMLPQFLDKLLPG